MNQSKDDQFAKDFGDFILRGRLKKGLTQAELAEMLGLSQSYYAYIEQGKRNVFLDLAMRICKCLDLPLEDFVALRYGDSPKKEEELPTLRPTDDTHDLDFVDPDQFRMDEY